MIPVLYKLKKFCEENDLPYQSIQKKLQKQEIQGVKVGRVWAIDESVAKHLLEQYGD